ncbi:hypothetical protein [Thermobrachium celere]|nr:hypothetical protein [Thermobrachium celere]
MTDNYKAISNEDRFKRIIKMAIDISEFNIRGSRRRFRHMRKQRKNEYLD